ncbi:MAG: hypothetical protein KY461_00130 [Actinobacteria bacterium]|nr:hypothetical protein [Actinomycetota bacterium]
MSERYDPNDQHVQATAASLVEMTAGVLQTDAASLWWYDDHQAYLVARYPEDRMPTLKVFADMPEVGASIRAAETQLYVRDEATGAVREWMERAGIAVSLRLPVESAEVARHFLGLSWSGTEHPPVASLLPTARRLANHISLALTRIVASRIQFESALELSDNVAQALVIAKASLQMDRPDDAARAIDRALYETQRIMTHLIRDDDTGNLRRLYPANTMGADAATDREPSER